MANYDPNDPNKTTVRETYVEPVEKRSSPLPLIIGILLAQSAVAFNFSQDSALSRVVRTDEYCYGRRCNGLSWGSWGAPELQLKGRNHSCLSRGYDFAVERNLSRETCGISWIMRDLLETGFS